MLSNSRHDEKLFTGSSTNILKDTDIFTDIDMVSIYVYLYIYIYIYI